MKLNTRIFGEIDIQEEKIINFPGGIIGFPELTDFALIHDVERDSQSPVKWLQSMQEATFAIPVMDPLSVVPDYNPMVEDELLKPIAITDPESVFVLVTLTVPKNVEEMSINLQAPIVINSDTKKACQVIVDTEKYPVKYKIYEILKKNKEGK